MPVMLRDSDWNNWQNGNPCPLSNDGAELLCHKMIRPQRVMWTMLLCASNRQKRNISLLEQLLAVSPS